MRRARLVFSWLLHEDLEDKGAELCRLIMSKCWSAPTDELRPCVACIDKKLASSLSCAVRLCFITGQSTRYEWLNSHALMHPANAGTYAASPIELQLYM